MAWRRRCAGDSMGTIFYRENDRQEFSRENYGWARLVELGLFPLLNLKNYEKAKGARFLM